MPALKENQKLFVVIALARFGTPEQVTEAVKQEYGVIVTKQQLGAYNPATRAGKRLSAKLRKVFEDTRSEFLEDVKKVPIANQAYRLWAMNRLYEKVEKQGNTTVAAQLLEQAAKEIGGAYTNRRELTGKGGGPIETRRNAQDFTDDELAALAAGGSAGVIDPQTGPG